MKKLITAAILIPSLCIIGSGCTTTKHKRMPVTPQPMACAGNVPAQITLYSPTEAKLTFEEKSYNLNRIETASGVKYGNDEITYWNKGIDTLITRKDGSMSTCTYIPKSGL